jgi:hypothetical protein
MWKKNYMNGGKMKDFLNPPMIPMILILILGKNHM